MTRLNSWRKSHLLASDALLTVAIVAAAIVACHLSGKDDDLLGLLKDNRAATYSSIASIAGSLLGFVITAVSIIAAFGGLPKFEILHRSPQYDAIFRVFFDSIYWLAATTVLSLVGLVVDSDKSPWLPLTIAAAFVFSITGARVWRCIWILQSLARILAKPIPETQPRPTEGTKKR